MRFNKIFVTDHALVQYLYRSFIMEKGLAKQLLMDARNGDKESRRTINKYRKDIIKKFSRTILTDFTNGGRELRRETKRCSMNKRCSFIAERNGNDYVIITTYLQGRKHDFWKVGSVS